MRSHSNSPVATFFMLAPLLAVPLLAVFGVPHIESKNSSDKQLKDKKSAVVLGKENSTGFDAEDIFESSTSLDDSQSDTVQTSPFRNSGSHGTSQVPVHYANNTAPKVGMQGWQLQNKSVANDQLRITTPTNDNTEDLEKNGLQNRFRSIDSEQLNDDFPLEDDKLKFERKSDQTDFQSGSNKAHVLSNTIKEDQNQFVNASPQNGAAMASISPNSGTGNPFTQYERDNPNRVQHANHTLPSQTQAPPQSWAAAVKRLNQLGISDFELIPGIRANEFLFRCSFTPADNPRITHRFEAEAAEPLRAVQRVILQVENWMSRR